MLLNTARNYLLGAALVASAVPAAACTPAPPLRRETGESDGAFEVRRQAHEAEAQKTPEQFELEEQARLWDEADKVFVGHIEAVKIMGHVYPRPKKRRDYRKKRGVIPPILPSEPIAMLPFPNGGEVHIRSLRLLKGEEDFKTSWHFVGGMNSCGSINDGALAFAYTEMELIIFASWQNLYQYVGGKEVASKRLNLYGLNFDEVKDRRLLTAIAGSYKAKAAPK